MRGARRFEFVHVDVFARRPLEGNPLAVFTDATGMREGEMQEVAREMRLSETTFVLPRAPEVERDRGVRVRIFTPREELPFAGHPTLGTAWELRNRRGGDEVTLDLAVGKVPVRFAQRGEGLFGEMVQPDPKWGATHDVKSVAAALGVESSDLDSRVPIETVSTGNPFVIVPFRSLEKLRALHPSPGAMEAYLGPTDGKFFYLVSRQTDDPGARLHARMIFSEGEDPATGSAAGPAGAWMLRRGWVKANEQVWIEQGIEVKRPSQIFVKVGGTPGTPKNVRVGGTCFGLIRGHLDLGPAQKQ